MPELNHEFNQLALALDSDTRFLLILIGGFEFLLYLLTFFYVTYSADGKSLYVSAEGKHAPVYRYDFQQP